MPDFGPLLEAFVPSAGGNNSTSFELPATVLESFIPGYAIIRKLALDVFGFDVSILVSVLGFFFIARTAYQYVYDWSNQLLTEYCTCSIDFDENDEPFEYLMKWLLAKNQVFSNVRNLRAAGRWWENLTRSATALEKLAERAHGKQAGEASAGIFNYEALSSSKPMGFEPARGTYRFWHRRRLFFATLYIQPGQYRYEDTLRLTLSCYGRTSDPLKLFLEETRAADGESRAELKTNIFRAVSSESDWRCVSHRPTRPLDTVSLDTAQKVRIVRDLNSFIHPNAQRWYSSRGIPYRRGYLFSGAPGTGKTSLSLALAGVFGLDLYAVSLQDHGLTEEQLTRLFDYLPDRCIVLLEDIDSAGIGNKRSPSTPGTPVPTHRSRLSLSGSEDGDRKRDDGKPSADSSGISLAGLLNAIDGVTAHEGHLLIMTSNHPEKLDPALRRPGRVDMHIEFSLASHFQAREIFLRMYTDEREAAPGEAMAKRLAPTVEDVCRERSELAGSRVCPFMDLAALDAAADAFVAAVPDGEMSPAEIQGYLLFHKMDPQGAVDGVREWVEETQRAKTRLGDVGGGAVEIRIEDADDCVKV